MGLSKSFADMKQLKRDLYGPPPRTRVTDTFKQTNLFEAEQPKQIATKPSAYDLSIGQVNTKNSKKIRENDTTRSYIFEKSDVLKEQHYKQGKKCQMIPSPQKEPLPLKSTQHRLKDHETEFFYNTDETEQRSLKSHPFHEYNSQSSITKDPRLIKLEEQYNTEISDHHMPGSGIPKRKSQFTLSSDIDKKFRTAHEMRSYHNLSNIHFQEESNTQRLPERKPASPVKQPWEPVPEFNEKCISEIKKKNHNFSDIFGLEYGDRNGQAKHKQLLSEQPASQQQRNRVMDQKSSMDSHTLYEQSFKPTTKLHTTGPTITRDVVKVSKW